MSADETTPRGRSTQLTHEKGGSSDGAEGHAQHEAANQGISTRVLVTSPSFDGVDLCILELMGRGLPDAAISKRLALSHRTVQRRVQRMMMRTGVASRFSFGLRVSELGLFRANDN